MLLILWIQKLSLVAGGIGSFLRPALWKVSKNSVADLSTSQKEVQHCFPELSKKRFKYTLLASEGLVSTMTKLMDLQVCGFRKTFVTKFTIYAFLRLFPSVCFDVRGRAASTRSCIMTFYTCRRYFFHYGTSNVIIVRVQNGFFSSVNNQVLLKDSSWRKLFVTLFTNLGRENGFSPECERASFIIIDFSPV